MKTPMGNNREWKHFQIWVERDGTRTPISQLRTSHLEFIINYIKRQHKVHNNHWREDWLPFLEEELAYRQARDKRLDNNRETT